MTPVTRPNDFRFVVLFMVLFVGAVMTLCRPAHATEFRDRSNNLISRQSMEGNRLVNRAPNGNMLDYWVNEGGVMVNRKPNGNLIGRATR